MFTDVSIQVKIKEYHRIMIHKKTIKLKFTPPYIPKNNVAAEDIFGKVYSCVYSTKIYENTDR